MEPWHADVFEFLDLKKNTGKEEYRARDLFYALWIPDLFMQRVEANEDWCLMCPHSCPGLSDCWGEEFEKLYTGYEAEGRYMRKVKAQDLWFAIIESQVRFSSNYLHSLKNNYFKKLCVKRLKLELPTCYTKTPATVNQINKMLAQSSAVTCAQKLLNTHRKMKLPFAIWRVLR